MKVDIMKIEGLILALFSVILLIGITNAQNTTNCIRTYPSNVAIPLPPSFGIKMEPISNQTATCNAIALTISTNANVMKCSIFPQLVTLYASNISFGRPLFFYYNASKNPNETLYNNLSLTLPNSKKLNFPVKSSILISVYPNGSIFENNNLLYKFSKPQNEIGSYSFILAEGLKDFNISMFLYGINANISNIPPRLNISLNISLPNNNLVFGYEHGFDNLIATATAPATGNFIQLELWGINDTLTLPDAPLIYNLYNLVPIDYGRFFSLMPYIPPPFANETNTPLIGVTYNKSIAQNSMNEYVEVIQQNISVLCPLIIKDVEIRLYTPYFWTNNSKPAFAPNGAGGKVLEINFTHTNYFEGFVVLHFNVTFENKTMESLTFTPPYGNITLKMATNPNESEVINGFLKYTLIYNNKTYYYKFTNFSLTQGQLKKIVIAIPPPPKTNDMFLYIFILLIIIILIIILWRIKKHLEKKKRKA